MAKSNTAKVQINRIQQVCIVVNNVPKTIEDYWQILGIGPWAIFTFGSPTVPDLKYYGKSAWGKYRGAVTQVGPLELELIETIEGDSIYQDWIDEHGETLHHMKFLVKDLNIDRVNESMEDLGFPSIMGGHIGSESQWQFSYFDTSKVLHVIWETSSRTGGIPTGAAFYPEDPNTVSPAKVKVSAIKQVTICVKDVMKTAENYWHILGIGPWKVYNRGSHILSKRFYHGKPAWGRELVALASIGEIELELVQPVEGDSIYQDWINEHGEGMHHLKFLCEDADEVCTILTDQGFPNLQSGQFSGVGCQ